MIPEQSRTSRSPVPLWEMQPSTGDFADAVTLPPDCYTSEEFFRFEMDAVFGHEWLCVGRADQVPNPGDYFTITMAGEPLIVVRNEAGDVNVMSSICRHRAMCITAPADRPQAEWVAPPPETSGNVRQFRCPYHWWTYNLDGRLTSAPEMKRTNNFQKSEITLPRIRVETWLGFIFINFDEGAPPLSPRLERLEDVLRNYDVANMVSVDPMSVPGLPFNWKVMAENFMEGYHPDRLHQGIHDFAPSKNVRYEPYHEGDAALIGYIKTTLQDGGFNPTYRALFPIIEGLTDEERWNQIFVFVPPTLLMGFQPDSAFWFVLQPTSAGTHTLSMAYIFPPKTVSQEMFPKLMDTAVHGVELFNNQDLPTNTAVQVGLASRFAPRGRYSWQEEVLSQFNTWLLSCYRRAEQVDEPQPAAAVGR